MKGIKHHLNVLIIALRVILFCLAVYALFHVFLLVSFLGEGGKESAKDFIDDIFKPLREPDTALFAVVFVALQVVLIIYIIITLLKLYKSFVLFERNYIFYLSQSEDLRRVGAGIIIFAKGRYLLFCGIGAVVYFDLTVFFKQLIPFLGLYLIGKLFLVLSFVSEKGEVLKEENDLTV